MTNQNPEQIARDKIDAMLRASGWAVQDKGAIDFNQGEGQAVREYTTDNGPADYVLFVDRKPVGVVEAKKKTLGQNITTAEDQTLGYSKAKLKWIKDGHPIPLLYEATGVLTRFTDQRDPKPRSREVFTFHRPESVREWLDSGKSLRDRIQDLPALEVDGLRECQIVGIQNLEKSFKEARPRALIQMATGSGKTYTAITFIYRLLKYVRAKRVLFLVDTKNLGEQAEQEFMAYEPSDDNRSFTSIYATQRLKSSSVPADAQVCISTIQRMYSILQGKELDESYEEDNPAEVRPRRREPFPVAYNERLPIEFFDFVVIDECHRSIYNLWQQVLDYFDAFLVGLTATPDNRTYGFFRQNVVSEYTHEEAVADGVNVGNEVYVIETEITRAGSELKAKQLVERREKLTRARRWELQDEDEAYNEKELDKKVVNPDQIRTIVGAFRDQLPAIFPDRQEVPKTLIFAKTDSHADDIIQIVREEFAESNQFCKKVTYKNEEDPKSVLAQFRNDYYPRIAVTVDMIATGTDVKPLECLLFMRDVKSRNYFEQMKGRGTRTLGVDDLKKVTPSAPSAKTHYVIVDAIGVTRSLKTASPTLVTKPTIPLKDLAMEVMHGASDTDSVSTLAARLARLDRQLDSDDQDRVEAKTGGVPLKSIVKGLFAAINADRVEVKALEIAGLPEGDPGDTAREKAQDQLVAEAAKPLTGDLITLLVDIRREKEQTIDHDNPDSLIRAEWDQEAADNAVAIASEFAAYLQSHRDSLTALTIFYEQPYRRREITFQMIKDVLAQLKADAPKLAPLRVWRAYEQLAGKSIAAPQSELTALVALIRHVCAIDSTLTPFRETVRRNFQEWIMKKHSGKNPKFSEEQLAWLQSIRDHVSSSLHFQREDLEYAPFDSQGGLGKMYQLFGDKLDGVIDELNEALVV